MTDQANIQGNECLILFNSIPILFASVFAWLFACAQDHTLNFVSFKWRCDEENIVPGIGTLFVALVVELSHFALFFDRRISPTHCDNSQIYFCDCV